MARDALRVLVVDDEPAMRLVLETRLRSWGYETLLAADADEAERLAKESPIWSGSSPSWTCSGRCTT